MTSNTALTHPSPALTGPLTGPLTGVAEGPRAYGEYSAEDLKRWISWAERSHFRDKEFARSLKEYFKPGSLLELGGATGQFVPIFQDLGFTVTGSDFQPFFVDYQRKVGLHAIRVDATDITKSTHELFDNIFAQGLSPLQRRELDMVKRVYRSAHQALTVGGRLVICQTAYKHSPHKQKIYLSVEEQCQIIREMDLFSIVKVIPHQCVPSGLYSFYNRKILNFIDFQLGRFFAFRHVLVLQRKGDGGVIDLNLHIYPTTFTHESRILKETGSLIEKGLVQKVIIAALWKPGLPLSQDLGDGRRVERIPLLSRFLPKWLPFEIVRYLELLWRVAIKFRSAAYINCHSLSVLPIGCALKAINGSKLIYDTHELETERNGLVGARKAVSKLVEKALMPMVDHTIAVGPRIAAWYQEQYRLPKVFVMRNIPRRADIRLRSNSIFREILGIPSEDRIFLYQGIVGRGRGIEVILQAFRSLPPSQHIVFMGEGPLVPEIQRQVLQSCNIHYLPPVPPEEVIQYTSGADVGLCVFERTCLSHYFVLPNKFFEYLLSCVPVIASDFPELHTIIGTYQCGWTVSPGAENLRRLILDLSTEEVLRVRRGAERVSAELCWENEAQVLGDIYRGKQEPLRVAA